MEIANVLSEKSKKERYIWLKNYLTDYDVDVCVIQNGYQELKAGMGSIKNYEESLKYHFEQLFKSYRHPHAEEI